MPIYEPISEGVCRVLLAEDTPSNAILVMEVLAMANCQTELVTDGLQAFQACQQREFDVVVMDVHMPEMDGIEATAAIRKWEYESGHRRNMVIGLTASAMSHEIDQCWSSGMDMVLTKPIDVPKLLGIMRSACFANQAD
ncbi:response regulator [Aquabacterium sp.]|uniref:response regulator n=1 Tax=Aquabacterium sp. TaxID=1872578 RepID=UPI004037B6D0